jgi:hypothetical protein
MGQILLPLQQNFLFYKNFKNNNVKHKAKLEQIN